MCGFVIKRNLDLLISCVNAKYNAANKIQWLAAAECQFTLKIKIGAIKKKRDPMIE